MFVCVHHEELHVPASLPMTIADQFPGGRVNLVGDCRGGWLAVVYAGLHPEHVNTLTIGGAPIDTHAGQFAQVVGAGR